MLSNRQCEVAKLMTGSETENKIIISEYEKFNPNLKTVMSIEIHSLVKQHNMPIDRGFESFKDDFISIADKYSINPATLFCVYMENINFLD